MQKQELEIELLTTNHNSNFQILLDLSKIALYQLKDCVGVVVTKHMSNCFKIPNVSISTKTLMTHNYRNGFSIEIFNIDS